MKVLILGISGMFGHVLFNYLSNNKNSFIDTWGTLRNKEKTKNFPHHLQNKIIFDVDAKNFETVAKAIEEVNADIIINCIGIIKQVINENTPAEAIYLNALFPHQLATFCVKNEIRLLHISTDCVFDGEKGLYREGDAATACDVYGLTKYLGEVKYKNCMTIRTSIIGHELNDKYGLLEWFLSQNESVKGFVNAIFSGFTTLELSKIIAEKILTSHILSGLYHVASQPISKYDLLKLVSMIYKKDIEIIPFPDFKCDRSLDGSKFNENTAYTPTSWEKQIMEMYEYFKNNEVYYVQR